MQEGKNINIGKSKSVAENLILNKFSHSKSSTFFFVLFFNIKMSRD